MADVFQLFSRLDKRGKLKLWKKIKKDCETYPESLVRIPPELVLQADAKVPKEAWRSRGYTVQVFDVNDEWERLTINRNAFDSRYERFLDGISWEKIQELKHECGRGGYEALELFPAEKDVKSLNLRQIWVKKHGSFMRKEGIGWKEGDSARHAAHSTISTFHTERISVPSDAKPEQKNVHQPTVSSAV